MDWRTSSYSADAGNCVQAAASWRTSSRSGKENCVEVADLDGVAVLVRDSQDPGGTVLALTPDAWRALTDRVKAADGA